MESKYDRFCIEIKLNRLTDASLVKVKENIKIYFQTSCLVGYKDVAECLYSLSKEGTHKNSNLIDNNTFAWSCSSGRKDVAEWLYITSKIDGNVKININTDSDCPFRLSCEHGYKDVAEWLYCLSNIDGNGKIDISACDHYSFRQSCENGHKEVAEWLCTLDSNYRINYVGDRMVPHIRDIKLILVENDIDAIGKFIAKSSVFQKSDVDCMVCLDNGSQYWVKLCCGHELCSNCFVRISRCPLRCYEHMKLDQVKLILNR
jgi:hypothetical protein